MSNGVSLIYVVDIASLIARFMGPSWGPPGSCRPQVGPRWAPCRPHALAIWDGLLSESSQKTPWNGVPARHLTIDFTVIHLRSDWTYLYNDVTWGLWRLKSTTTRLCVHQFAWVYGKIVWPPNNISNLLFILASYIIKNAIVIDGAQ